MVIYIQPRYPYVELLTSGTPIIICIRNLRWLRFISQHKAFYRSTKLRLIFYCTRTRLSGWEPEMAVSVGLWAACVFVGAVLVRAAGFGEARWFGLLAATAAQV
jgi:hypothetical protein